MEDPRIRKFAQFLIRSAVGLEKGEKILIELHGSETGLMKSLVQEAYAVGGKPFVHIFDYAVEGALVQGADAEHMEEIASYELERMRDMDAYIDIRATTNISMWHNVSDEAQKRYRQYYWGPIHLAERCNHTKWSVLRYPNDAMAQLAGVSTEEYEDFYFRACLVDYDKMGRAMQPLQDLMARTDKVRIVAPGTDISFSIKGIPSFGMHGNRNIPDGEIYTSSLIGTILPGITRASMIEVMKDWGYKVHEERVAIADIMKAADEGKLEEVFGTGTAAVVSPVKELDWEGKVAHISGGHIGELTQKLYDTLTGIQWGKLPDTKGWIVPVE